MKNDLSPEAMQNLLKEASRQLGTDPATLSSQLRSGSLGNAMSKMSPNEKQMLSRALSDKENCRRVLSSPQAQALIRKLGGK